MSAIATGPLSAAQVDAYLRVLGVPRATPSLDSLRALVRAHLVRVPFENISKLYRRKVLGLCDVPSLDLFLADVEQRHFGGTCYANNFHLFRLLEALGYDAVLCGADMPSGEDVHAAIRLSLDGREFLVDAGYAAPFLEPLPRDSPERVVVSLGRDRYVLEPRDEQGRSLLSLYRASERIHGYLLKPTSRPIEYFRGVVRSSFDETATFMNAVMLVRFFDTRSVSVHNLTLVHSTAAGVAVETLADRRELARAVERYFEIPSAVVREAIGDLGALCGVYR